MPKLSVWAVRLSLVNLVVAWAVGATLMINRAFAFTGAIWELVEIHGACALFGWTLQLVVGVAYRMLPTFGRKQGRPVAAWTSVAAINAGVVWTVVRWFVPAAPLWGAVGLWTLGVAAFGWHLWPRVKAFGG